jgi:autotransporter adhesin
MALGYGSNVSQTEAMAVGSFSSVSGSKSTALGHSSQVSQTEAMALGYNAKASGSHSFAAGHSPEASGNKAVAIGEGAKSTANETIAIGNGSLSNANKSLAIGNGAQAIANNAVAIGNDAIANQQNTLILGAVNGGPSVGIGTASPLARLDVNDSFKLGQKGSVHKGMASFVENYLNVQVNANSTAIAAVTIPTDIRLTGTQATVIVTLDNSVSDDISVVWCKLRDNRTIRLQIRNSGTANWYGGKMYFTVIEF